MHRFVFNLDNFTPERILYTDTARGASDKVWQQRNPKKISSHIASLFFCGMFVFTIFWVPQSPHQYMIGSYLTLDISTVVHC